MKKKVISAALAGTLAVSLLSACGASNEPQNISDVFFCCQQRSNFHHRFLRVYR